MMAIFFIAFAVLLIAALRLHEGDKRRLREDLEAYKKWAEKLEEENWSLQLRLRGSNEKADWWKLPDTHERSYGNDF
jgi:hypothetical protein